MKTSKTRFVTIFLLLAFALQFIVNSLLGVEVSLFPPNGDWYPGLDSPVAWKHAMASITYPIRYVLIEPLSFLAKEPDPAPPILLAAFALYWAAIALVLYFLISKVKKIIQG